MKSATLKYANRVGEIVVSASPLNSTRYTHYKSNLELIRDSSFTDNKDCVYVYYFLVDDEVYKIGQSSAKGGFIQGCLSFYLKAGNDDSGPNRFAINYLIREELAQGKTVEVYVQPFMPAKSPEQTVNGINRQHKLKTKFDAKECEKCCINDYLSSSNNTYPKWNFQEAGLQVPKKVDTAFNQYRTNRKK